MERTVIVPEIIHYRGELEVGIQAVMAAGKTIIDKTRNHSAERHGLEFKAEVDRLADESGIKVLKEAFPDDAILTEERGLPKEQKSRLWVCDFLDGTTNFLNGSRNYSVLVAFVEKGEVKIGISYLPITDELFYAVLGEGTYRNGKRTRVSPIGELKRSTIVLDPGYDPEGGRKVADLYQKLRSAPVGNVGAYNANGYTLSMLANGEMGGFVHFSSKIWECSALLIAQEAGARITDFKGEKPKLDFTNDAGFPFIASNSLIHDELLSIVSKCSF